MTSRHSHRFGFIARLARLTAAAALLSIVGSADAGSVFVTGHDPDFHASLGGNFAGARNINTTAINFIQDPGFNPFFAGGINKFLFVESRISVPGGHTIGKNGITASGYTEGVNFDHHDASTLNAAINQLGQPGGYSAIVVASDFGGILTQAELNVLNTRSPDIISFVNNGGGLYAMAESNLGAGLTPGGGHYGFLPFLVTSLNLNQSESGYMVTPFGASLGLTNADVNGNFSHNIFTSTGGLDIVDVDSQGQILSLATRSRITPGGVVPLPTPLGMGVAGLAGVGVAGTARRRRPTPG